MFVTDKGPQGHCLRDCSYRVSIRLACSAQLPHTTTFPPMRKYPTVFRTGVGDVRYTVCTSMTLYYPFYLSPLTLPPSLPRFR
jgi:hypothetical protein